MIDNIKMFEKDLRSFIIEENKNGSLKIQDLILLIRFFNEFKILLSNNPELKESGIIELIKTDMLKFSDEDKEFMINFFIKFEDYEQLLKKRRCCGK
jgi:hypothetical protein